MIPADQESGGDNRLAATPFEESYRPAAASRTVQLLGKYGSTSLIATSADFAAFHTGLAFLGVSPVWATVTGRSAGSVVAFLLHRSWVFRKAGKADGNTLIIKYVLGILIGMGLNAGGVWFLNGMMEFDPWPARIATATSVWLFGFLFNRKFVFGQNNP